MSRIIAGQDERVNWLKLNKFVNDCLPRPNGENLTNRQKDTYWKSGEDAWKRFEKGQGAIRDDGSSDTEEELKHLVLVNVEAVDALFTDDLGGFFQRLTDKNKALFGMDPADQKAQPKGSGWVVEIRGFTYHNGQHVFLLDTLVDNLNTKRNEATVAKKADAKAEAKKDEKKSEDAKAEQKHPDVEPIKGNISHVAMFYRPGKNPIGANFELIKDSLLMPLVAGVATDKKSAGGLPTPPPPTPGGKSVPRSPNQTRAGWKALGAETLASLNPKAPDLIFNQLGAAQPDKVEKVEKGQYIRTEFIVLFVWREPTPSDALKGSGSALPTTPAPTRPGFNPKLPNNP